MNSQTPAGVAPRTGPSARLRDYAELSKPRVTILVWITTLAGLALAGGLALPGGYLAAALGGSLLVIASANALNQVFEAAADGRMNRTRSRPVPAGRISSAEGLAVGLVWGVAGVGILAAFVNLLTAGLGVASIILYAGVYTPLKPRTHLCTAVGAIPGAIPPLAGWAAVTGEVALPAFVLFAIQFLWQFPHFWAIAWILREDYGRAGFRMLPFPGADARATARVATQFADFTAPVSAVYAMFVTIWWAYLAAAAVLGAWLVYASVRFLRDGDDLSAKRLLRVTVLYLPLLLLAACLAR
jgi:protoheme IX farnesyltransferase